MPLTTPHKYPERILIYGEPGVGKSNAVIQTAKFLSQTSTPSKIFVIDNDRSYVRAAENNNITNMQVADVYDFPEYRDALSLFIKSVQPHDFLVCDLMSEAWTAAQTHYTDSVYGDEANYFLQVRSQMSNPTKDGNVLEGWYDWQYINKQYFAFAKPFIYRSPCHVIAVSTADPISRSGRNADDKETLTVFSSVGYRPEGQKRLKHQFDTTIFMFKDNSGGYRMTTVKDRDRELVTSAHVVNFPVDYLMRVANWTLA